MQGVSGAFQRLTGAFQELTETFHGVSDDIDGVSGNRSAQAAFRRFLERSRESQGLFLGVPWGFQEISKALKGLRMFKENIRSVKGVLGGPRGVPIGFQGRSIGFQGFQMRSM